MTDNIVLIHGLHQNHLIMTFIKKKLIAQGFTVKSFTYPTLFADINKNTTTLHKWLKNNYSNDDRFHIIAHSLGGLLLRQLTVQYPYWLDNGNLCRCVTLGTPHLGSITADYAKRILPLFVGKAYKNALDGTMSANHSESLEIGVIAGNKAKGLGTPIISYHNKVIQQTSADKTYGTVNDGTVYLHETLLPSAKDHIILPTSHTGMLFNNEVLYQSVHFLKNGTFNQQLNTN